MNKPASASSLIPGLSCLEEGLYAKGYQAVCGVDEVGRGPLAGPVVAAAVILPPGLVIEGLDDSKRLSPQRRERVFERIVALGLECAVGVVDQDYIDRVNIHRASLTAMCKAVKELKRAPDFVLVDGRHCIPNLSQPQLSIVRGDSLCDAISAASVIAKITRDRIMDRFEIQYPSFSFATHKGYPTPAHLRELKECGPCDIHRKSFKPVAELLNEYTLV
ncbi:MAG: ribonuclease HII [Candidatus Zixiibacteriota bacterium]|nr:MAG: ribonuclease HII [candidate division Zixibacteria bacterium]